MTNWYIVAFIVAVYLIANLVVGLLPGTKSSDTVTGYVAGDREFGTLVMYFVTGATVFSAFAFLGGPGWSYSRGAAAFYILGYGVLGMAPFFAIGPWAARLGRKHGYVTQGSMLSHRFQNTWVGFIAGVISVVAMLPYVALQMRGAGIVIEQVTAGHVPYAWGAALTYGVVLTYVWHSGVKGIGWTNVFQGVFMIVIAWAFGLYIPWKLYGGIAPMFEQLASVRPELLTVPGLAADGTPWTPGAYTSAVMISAIGLMMWPHLFMKAFAAKSDATIRRTIVLFPTFQLFLLPLFLIGFAGVMYSSAPAEPDAIMPHIMLTSGLPAVWVGLFCAGALAASMSTGDALVHGAASIAITDVYGKLRTNQLTQHDQRRLIRFLALAVGILAYLIALNRNMSLVGMLLMAYGAIVQLAPPVYAAFLWRRATAAGAIAGLLTGSFTTALLLWQPGLKPFGIHEGIVGLAVNILVLVVVSIVTQPPEKNHVAEWYNTSRTPEP